MGALADQIRNLLDSRLLTLIGDAYTSNRESIRTKLLQAIGDAIEGSASEIAAEGGGGPPGPQGDPGDPSPVSSVNGQIGAVVLDAVDVGADAAGTASGLLAAHVAAGDPHAGYVLESREGVAGGVATLDGSTLVPRAQLGTGVSGFLGYGGAWAPLDVGDIPDLSGTYQPLNASLTAISAGAWTGAVSITTLGIVGTGTWQGTAIGVAYGGTGATSQSDARTNLGLVIGADVAAASHTHAASDITSGTIATARLGSGTASADYVLAGDSTWKFSGIRRSFTAGTAVSNSTVLIDYSPLDIASVPAGIYEVTGGVHYISAATPKIKIGFALPSGSTMAWVTSAMSTSAAPLTESDTIDGPGSVSARYLHFKGVLEITTPGTVKLQYAQFISNATPTQVTSGWLTLQ